MTIPVYVLVLLSGVLLVAAFGIAMWVRGYTVGALAGVEARAEPVIEVRREEK